MAALDACGYHTHKMHAHIHMHLSLHGSTGCLLGLSLARTHTHILYVTYTHPMPDVLQWQFAFKCCHTSTHTHITDDTQMQIFHTHHSCRQSAFMMRTIYQSICSPSCTPTYPPSMGASAVVPLAKTQGDAQACLAPPPSVIPVAHQIKVLDVTVTPTFLPFMPPLESTP